MLFSSSSYYFFTGLQQNVFTLWGEKVQSLSSYFFLHVCDLFSYENVNVNMHFEAVLLLVVHLVIDVLT